MNKRIVCLSGPSGVGKTSYIKRLTKKYNFLLPQTVTTRKKRDDDGPHYRYIDKEEFIEMTYKKYFAEWDEYLGHYYGTSMASIDNILQAKNSAGCILDITPKSCLDIKNLYPNALIISLLPDNPEWLLTRLQKRNNQPLEEIIQRMETVQSIVQNSLQLGENLVYANYSEDSWDETFAQIETIIFNGAE